MTLAIPTSLYVIPVDEALEGQDLDVISTAGWDSAPREGSLAILVPVDMTVASRRITKIYRITAVYETGRRDWPWELDVESHEVPTPQTWYEITSSILREGLVPILGTSYDGVRLTDPATIELIWELLGLAS